MQSNPEHEVGCSDEYYSITRESLAEIVQANCADAIITQYGGIENIVTALRTNLDVGIKGDEADLRRRRQAFGRNFISNRRPLPTTTIQRIKNILSDASSDTTILLLFCCVILSLAIGFKTNGAAEALVDGALFLLVVSLIVSFGALVRFLKARLKTRRSSKQNDEVWVMRGGMVYPVLESELVVGDIAFLRTGDLVPADGIFINGDDSFQLNAEHPCLFRGEKVVAGHHRMLVTSVGDDTERSRLVKITENGQDDDGGRLQLLDAIEKTSSKLDKIWLSLSLLLLVLQFVRCFVSKKVEGDKDRSSDPKGVKNRMEDLMKEVMKKERSRAHHGLVTMLCVLLFATRDGLPLALFVSFMYASNRMKSLDAIVRKLEATPTFGLATTICTCKTADLALQHSKMADLWIGFDLVDDHMQERVDRKVLEALRRGIFVHSSPRGGVEEISLLTWARAVLGLDLDHHHSSSMVRRGIGTDLWCWSEKIESVEGGEVVHVHWGGAPELIWSMCSHYYTVDGGIQTLDAAKTAALVENLVGSGECCFAFAYKRVIVEFEEALKSNLTLLGFVRLKNPYSPHLIKAVEDCRRSGVRVRLVVDDDVNTARIMAVNSGILRPENDDGAAVVEGGDFRSMSDDERMTMADKIVVMANATPSDKMLMMRCLRRKGHVVAAAASAVRDSPMLKQADVGILMGDRRWTEISKDDGDIMVPTCNLSEIPPMVSLGRRVCSSLEKFLQLQLTMEISAFAINMISVAATSKEALGSFQVLWVNLTMEILGAAAVAATTVQTPPPGLTDAGENPVYGSGRIVTRAMCRGIAVQSLFQVGVILTMAVKGETVFQVNEFVVRAMIFNLYAFCQVFLLISGVEIKRNGAVSSGSWLFVGMVEIIGILQVAAVEIMGAVAQRPRLGVRQWCVCVGIASLSLPLNCAVNRISIYD